MFVTRKENSSQSVSCTNLAAAIISIPNLIFSQEECLVYLMAE